jgi:hypothetical protein
MCPFCQRVVDIFARYRLSFDETFQYKKKWIIIGIKRIRNKRGERMQSVKEEVIQQPFIIACPVK